MACSRALSPLSVRDANGLPNVTIQILTSAVGAHPGATTPFPILAFPEVHDPTWSTSRRSRVACGLRTTVRFIDTALPLINCARSL
ncbi:Scr1 family TA system antitoxin-like transcriptional regulator [Nonomuraea sp. NPDC049158]|uniref:Scr1 family TA system antitoxin-like transcriptional regulator n=1 Tax=Nonomuraea sp. NPDC049158 TaxID=3155649 RepID=UPI0033D1024A